MAGARSAAKLGAALLLAAAAFDAAPLYVAGAAFCLLAAACTAWVLTGASGLTVERRRAGRRGAEDEPLHAEIVITSARVAVPSCVVRDPLLAEPEHVRGGHRSVTVAIEARFPRRGRHIVESPVVTIRDPLGLAAREVAGGEGNEVLVLPRVEPILAA